MEERAPRQLLDALTVSEREGLTLALEALGPELADLYAAEVLEHREARGDNGQLFGMKLWIHGWFRYEELFSETDLVQVIADNGSWELRIGRLRIGIYRQGSHIDEDVHHEIPHADSETKRSYGVSNAAQLALFESDDARPVPTDASLAALRDLTLVHFGNSTEGLVKWYLGAQRQPGQWAWVQRQPRSEPGADTGGNVVSIRPSGPRRPNDGGTVPFDQRPVEEVEITARQQPNRAATDDPE